MNRPRCEVRKLSANIRTSGGFSGARPLGRTTTTNDLGKQSEVRSISAPIRCAKTRAGRQARILKAKRQFGDRPLTFAQIGVVSNPRFIDLSHRRFTRLLVVGYAGIGIDVRPNGEKKSYRLWRCKCDCGQFIITRANSLLMGKTRSCSCLRREKARARFRTLHLLERQLGAEALVGLERLSGMDHATTILANALGSLPPVPDRGRHV